MPRQPHPVLIPLPPRLTSSFSHDSDTSGPSTPQPHTPLPYEYGFGIDLAAQHAKNGLKLDELEFTPSSGSKRVRDQEEDEEVDWTPDELEEIRSTLLHPYRPLSTSYPPGELPPPAVIDELANQILAFAYKTSPSRSRSSPTRDDDTRMWRHSWAETRHKVFDLALAESRQGGPPVDKSVPRKERTARPGLKRMDSMDFLDEAEDDSSTGRTMRLSTSLQNSAKQASTGVQTSLKQESLSRPMSRSSSGSLPRGEAPMSITITPASPENAPGMRRKGSFRGMQGRPQRPTSLLQRGRSFTAGDLDAEAAADQTNRPSSSSTPTDSPRRTPSPTKPKVKASSPAKIQRAAPLRALTDLSGESRLPRSLSSSALQPAHQARDAFMTHEPLTTDPSALAMPLSLAPTMAPTKSASGWSDSEDEAPTKRKKTKAPKTKQAAKRTITLDFGLGGLGGLDGGALRSPFEERAEFF